MRPRLRHDHTLNPITALASFNPETESNYLLAAEGVYLKVYDLSTNSPRLIATCKVFSSQTIHGIVIRDVWDTNERLQAVIWGGTSIVLLNVNAVRSIISGAVDSVASKEQAAVDWILDVALSSNPDEESCVFITAHNETVLAKTRKGTPKLVYEKLDSPSRSILYSAHLTFDSPGCVTVAAGTVFGEIILWQCYPGRNGSKMPSRVLHTFTGHEGSIFGVNISPVIFNSNGTSARYLASCSDDRTIRVWDITADSEKDSSAAPYSLAARETGFGPNHEKTGEDDRCTAVVMAHASRIWRVKFLLPRSDEVDSCDWINLLSFGEDSDTQQWCLKQNSNNAKATLDHVQTSAFHSGKHIWSATIGHHITGGRYLATGGADGTIASSLLSLKKATLAVSPEEEPSKSTVPTRTTNLSELGPQYGIINKDFEMSVQEILRELPGWKPEPIPELQDAVPVMEEPQETLGSVETKPKKKKIKPVKIPTDAFNRYAFVSDNEYLVITTFGKVLLATICSEGLKCEEIPMPESCENDLRSYAVVAGAPDHGVAFLAGANGNLFMYSGRRIILTEKLTSKCADIFVAAQGSQLHQMATMLGSTMAVLNSYEIIGRGRTVTIPASSSVIQLSPGFVVTSMAVTSTLLILGSRNGTLDVYSWEDLRKPIFVSREIDYYHEENNQFDTRAIPWKSQDAITKIIELPRSDSVPTNTSNILLSSRDGTYTIVAITASFEDAHVSKAQLAKDHKYIFSMVATITPLHQSSPPLGQIEDTLFAHGNLILSGFRSKRFIVWNETLQQEIGSIECGGAHRSYASNGFQGIDKGGKFVYTKASKMYLHEQLLDSHIIIKRGGHGREIKACAVSQDRKYFATGAEDTTIRIWRYCDSGERAFEPLATIQKHTAGIQHLQWYDSTHLFSSGGNEEFFIWAISEIPGFGIGVVCEASCPEQTEDKDLRIMSFDVSLVDIEAWYTGFIISLAYSDSTMRTYKYTKPEGFSRLFSGEYSSACLMHIKHIRRGTCLWGLTAATDGYLALWELGYLDDSSPRRRGGSREEIAVIARKSIHQSAIKAMDVAIFEDSFVVATAGDDNSVALSCYEDGSILPKSLVVRSAHTAAVTAMTLLPFEPSRELRMVSSSNDQRVISWAIKTNPLEISVIDDVFTSIADVGDIGVLRDSTGSSAVLLVGNGMDVWSASSSIS